MTAADKLRQEMAQDAPFTKDELISALSRNIRFHGYASYICDRHISETRIDGHTISPRHEQTAIRYATSEGFSYHYEHNSYGVRKLVFTL